MNGKVSRIDRQRQQRFQIFVLLLAFAHLVTSLPRTDTDLALFPRARSPSVFPFFLAFGFPDCIVDEYTLLLREHVVIFSPGP